MTETPHEILDHISEQRPQDSHGAEVVLRQNALCNKKGLYSPKRRLQTDGYKTLLMIIYKPKTVSRPSQVYNWNDDTNKTMSS